MKHLNDNILCVIDIETTGLTPGVNEIVEICVLPLDFALDPDRVIMPFSIEIAPLNVKQIDPDIHNIQKKTTYSINSETVCGSMDRIQDIARRGLHPEKAGELFVKWFEGLNLRPQKRICPIAHNWVFDRPFIVEWLGQKTFDYCFNPQYRDTMGMALFANDSADARGEDCPYPKVNLAYLCSQLKIERIGIHTALDDCVATAAVYKRLVQASLI